MLPRLLLQDDDDAEQPPRRRSRALLSEPSAPDTSSSSPGTAAAAAASAVHGISRSLAQTGFGAGGAVADDDDDDEDEPGGVFSKQLITQLPGVQIANSSAPRTVATGLGLFAARDISAGTIWNKADAEHSLVITRCARVWRVRVGVWGASWSLQAAECTRSAHGAAASAGLCSAAALASVTRPTCFEDETPATEAPQLQAVLSSKQVGRRRELGPKRQRCMLCGRPPHWPA